VVLVPKKGTANRKDRGKARVNKEYGTKSGFKSMVRERTASMKSGKPRPRANP